jgi:hypothetical protein
MSKPGRRYQDIALSGCSIGPCRFVIRSSPADRLITENPAPHRAAAASRADAPVEAQMPDSDTRWPPLAPLGAMMLAPDDRAFREQYLASFATGPQRRVSKKFQKYYAHGFFAGELLGATIREYLATGRFKLGVIKGEMAARKFGRRTHDVSLSTIENTIWRRYRPVSHWWAAHVYMTINESETALPVPCPLDRLEEFLAFADFFATKGVETRMLRRKETILSTDSMLPVPLEFLTYRLEADSR